MDYKALLFELLDKKLIEDRVGKIEIFVLSFEIVMQISPTVVIKAHRNRKTYDLNINNVQINNLKGKEVIDALVKKRRLFWHYQRLDVNE